MRKYSVISGIIVIAILIVFAVVMKFEPLKSPAHFSSLISEFAELHNSGFFELKEQITKLLDQSDSSPNQGYWAQIGITSHHLPVVASFIADFYKTLLNSDGPRSTFVIVGPDHFERCRALISTTKKAYSTPFGVLYPNDLIIDRILEAGAYLEDDCFDNEHSIGVQTIFIKHLFPDAKIVPLIFSADAKDDSVNDIVRALAEFKDEITVITSIDFSHYYPYEKAIQLDGFSEEKILGLDYSFFNLKYVDSPASIKLAILLAKEIGSDKPIVLNRSNSYDFTGQLENTTGYINVIFADYKKTKDLATLMFVGDIMLSRRVGEKITENNDWRWPFLEIADYFKEADLLFGNLEGPISDRGKNVGSKYSFRADPRVIEGLKYAGFDILSVANNHIGDWSRVAMEDTLRILKENSIDCAGGGFSETEAHTSIIKEIKETKFAFLAYTVLGSRYTEAKDENSGIAWLFPERMKQDIQRAQQESDFVIVSIHFGEEYQERPNVFQQNIARAAIEAGGSIVIGHHPHVIQETEEYNDGYIAYSLGNFIFDQTFSEETMKGLLLKVLIRDKNIISVEPVEINISEEFQAGLSDL